MADLNEQPWAEFADRLAKELIEHGATEAAIVTHNENENRVVTNYYNCNFEKRCVLIGHLLNDLVCEIIEVNAGLIREILEDSDGDPD